MHFRNWKFVVVIFMVCTALISKIEWFVVASYPSSPHGLRSALSTCSNDTNYYNLRDGNGNTVIRKEDNDPDSKGQPPACAITDPSSIKFLLYNDNGKPEILEYLNMTSVTMSQYVQKNSTKFLIHGFMQHDGTNFPRNVREAYQAVNSPWKHNIIVVDWGPLACTTHQDYGTALKNVVKVGQRVGEFISFLHFQGMLDLAHTHIVGHSLGSHVAGTAGDTVNKTTGQPIGRITGLDPAGPEYEVEVGPARGIRPNDAQFVDVIHTNIGEFGISRSVGHVDFYVNGGATQPECATAVNDVFCSHQMSTWYFANTIKKHEDFKRCACKSSILYPVHPVCCEVKVKFGEFSDPLATGVYYLNYRLTK